MTDRLTQFVWRRAKDGYRWVQTHRVESDVEGWYLTHGVPIGTTYPGLIYSPMEETGLFRTFSELKPNKEGIAEFASRYGLLTTGELLKTGGRGEHLEFWRWHIGEIRHADALWRMAQARDIQGLKQFIVWDRDQGVRYEQAHLPKNHRGGRWIATEHEPELFAMFEVGDTIRPAWFQLQYMVNEQLSKGVSARLLWNAEHTQIHLHQVPKDLISALWLQLARAIDGERSYKQCEQCRNWFEISSPDGGRADKQYCGSACRSRAHYLNKTKGKSK
jgi:hypothetical protein